MKSSALLIVALCLFSFSIGRYVAPKPAPRELWMLRGDAAEDAQEFLDTHSVNPLTGVRKSWYAPVCHGRADGHFTCETFDRADRSLMGSPVVYVSCTTRNVSSPTPVSMPSASRCHWGN